MKTKMKALTLALCAVMLVATTVFVTVAYLTSTTETVTNTFTVGNVKITLDEADVDINGDPIEGADRVIANEYKLMPGHTYTKDPTVHVDAKSEDCYVFVKVSNSIKDIEATDDATNQKYTIATQMAKNNWKVVDEANGLYIYAEGDADKTAVAADADLTVFEYFKIAGTVKNDELDDYATEYQKDEDGNDKVDEKGNKILVENTDLITVQAYAIQADGFEGMEPTDIWNAFTEDNK